MKRKTALLLVCCCLLLPVTGAVAAIDRNETVYVTLDNHGQPENIRVVTWLRGQTGQAEWIDYGTYDQVENSVSDLAPRLGEGIIAWPSEALEGAGLFYQGTTSKPLPFAVSINYFLDGKAIDPADLAGQSGQVKIHLQVRNQSRQVQNVPYLDYEGQQKYSRQVLYTPMLMQVNLALPVETWSDIQAPTANQVMVGDQLRLSWALFPYPEADFVLQMQGKEISLSPMEINVLPMMPALPSLGTEAKVQLEQLLEGVTQLRQALQQMSEAAGSLAAGQQQAIAGGQALGDGISQLAQALQETAGGAQELAAGLAQLQGSHQQLAASSSLLQQLGDPRLEAIAAGLLAEEQALQQLTAAADALAGGLNASSEAFGYLVSQSSGLFSGWSEIAQGQEQLAAGLAAIDAEGLAPLWQQAVSQYAELQAGEATTEAMEQLVERHHSFIDNGRNKQGKVQYLLRTAGIELPQPPAVAEPVATETEKLSWWQRIVRFFTGK